MKAVSASLTLLLHLQGQLLAGGCENLRFVASVDTDHYVEGSKVALTYFLLNQGDQIVHVCTPDPLLWSGLTWIDLDIFDAVSGEPVRFCKVLTNTVARKPVRTGAERLERYQELHPKQLTGIQSFFDTHEARLGPGVYDFYLTYLDLNLAELADWAPAFFERLERQGMRAKFCPFKIPSNPVRVTITEGPK